jgi:hypothetical protein
MKTAETPVTPRSTPEQPLEVPLRHAALVVGRGHAKILAQHCAQLAVVSVRQSSPAGVGQPRIPRAPVCFTGLCRRPGLAHDTRAHHYRRFDGAL